jgi:hypothetical protein
MTWYKKQLEILESKKGAKKKPAVKEPTKTTKKVSAAEALRMSTKPSTKIVNPIDRRNRSRPKTDLY